MNQFYTVPEDAWLFRTSVPSPDSDGQRSPCEEAVRQWCLHELIRGYGVRVSCLEIERRVKVARERRPHRANIVVLRDGRPYVVVECKAREVKGLDSAADQAQTYASLADMQCTYAVATNGHEWRVHRIVDGAWLPVADLPSFADGREAIEWRSRSLTIISKAPMICPKELNVRGDDMSQA
jgi:hypothetical protein